LRQFHQIGIEVIGPGAFQAYLDAEVIHLSVRLLENFGIKDFTLKLNTLGSFEDKKEFSRYLRTNLEKQKDGLCKDCQDRFDRNVFRILDCKQEQCIDIVGQLKLDNSYYSKESRDYFESVKEALDILGVKYVLTPTLVRGLDYYTHTVFEITGKSLGSQDALGAGGRYNRLLKDLGFNDARFEPEAGAMGFSLGIERIILALNKKGSMDEDRLDAYLMAGDQDKMYKQSFKLLEALRGKGISADMFYRNASRKNKERAAQRENNPKYYLYVEEESGKDKSVVVENRETKQKAELAIDAVDQIADLVRGQL
jgi:histidyl-tRNA synthetase